MYLIQRDGYEGCSGVEQKKRRSEVSVEKEIQTETIVTGDIYGVYHWVEVDLQLRKLDEVDGHRRHVHSLRMTWIHTVG